MIHLLRMVPCISGWPGDWPPVVRLIRVRPGIERSSPITGPDTFRCVILFFFFLIYLFIYLFLAVLGLRFCARAFSSCGKLGPLFIAVRGPLTIVASLVGSTGSRRAGSVVVAHGPSCSVAYGIFPDLGSNPCPLHWQADSQPLRHQGSPRCVILEGTAIQGGNFTWGKAAGRYSFSKKNLPYFSHLTLK